MIATGMESADGWKVLLLGAMIMGGFLAHLSGPMIHVPRVTLLLLLGALFGTGVLDIVPDQATDWFPFIAHLALAVIGFLLGEEFLWQEIRNKGKQVLVISLGETLVTVGAVFVVVYLLRQDWALALIFAGIAPASAPAAILETAREGRAKGELTDTLLEVVAIDDAWGVIAFSVLLVAASAVGNQGTATSQLLLGLWEIFGAIGLGLAFGFPMAWISSRIRGGQLTLIETAGMVFLQTGIATMIGVSYLLAAIVLGAVVVNVAFRKKCFKEIEHIREPLLAVFFILAGLKLDVNQLIHIGWLGLAYILARAGGLVLGGWGSGKLLGADANVRNRIGWCIMPQAGVALGLALLVQDHLPAYGDQVLTIVIASTVLFEIVGPLFVRFHLHRAGEWAQGQAEP